MVLLLAIGVTGVAMLVTYPQTLAERDRYNALPRCAAGVTAGDTCWVGVPGTVMAVGTRQPALAVPRNYMLLRIASGGGEVEFPPTLSFFCAAPGDPALLKFWNGRLTGVYTAHGFVPTLLNPNVGYTSQEEGGILLVCVALVIPVAVVINRMRALRNVHHPWRAALDHRAVKVALVLFGLGQLADVVSSALGNRNGLLEGNPVVADFIRVTGPIGFLIFRLPIIALALMGLLRLPRTLVVGVLTGCALYFGAVGVHNTQLALASVTAPTCPAPTALP